MATTDRKYALRYMVDFKKGEFVKADAEGKYGLTDALLVASILFEPDGSTSTVTMSVDGRQPLKKDGRLGELPDTDWFKIWSYLAKDLQSMDINQWQKDIANDALEQVKLKILADRKPEDN